MAKIPFFCFLNEIEDKHVIDPCDVYNMSMLTRKVGVLQNICVAISVKIATPSGGKTNK